jgi:hypothetical protein
MIRRAIFLSVVLSSFLAGSAQAGFFTSGWGIVYGSIEVHANLKGIKNPTKKPSIVILDAILDEIEFLCLNPNGHNVAPGAAGVRIVSVNNVLTNDNVEGKGKGSVDFTFEVPGQLDCVNPNWTFLPDSEVAKVILITMTWFECTGVVTENPQDACYDGNDFTINKDKPIDILEGICSLDDVLREDDGTVVVGQEFGCEELP